MNSTLPNVPTIFISYSWSSSEKVLELAKRLMSNGVNVILDKWDLKEGHDKYAFMEQSVNNPEVDKVLIICDKSYVEKANNRDGGVGDETVIISPEIYGNVEQDKFIPVIFEVDENAEPYRPAYIKSRIFIDLSTEDNKYETEYEKLLRNIHNKPLYRKPSIGAVPEWLENESVDFSIIRDLIKQIRGYTGSNKTKSDFLIRKCNDELISALLAIEKKTNIPEDEALLLQIDTEKILRDLFVDFLEALIYNDLSAGKIIPSFIEQVYNTTHDAKGKACAESDFEFYDFVLWEMLICTVAVLLHYEQYIELNQILTHTYFLKESYFNAQVNSYTYDIFRKYFHTIEDVCKPKSDKPKCITFVGEIITRREKKPIITKASLANADVVLYQMFSVLELKDKERHDQYWYPLIYPYCYGRQPMWQMLKSKAYCEKIMPLFGVKTIEELKESVARNTDPERGMRYKSFDSAPTILRSVKLDEIGSLN